MNVSCEPIAEITLRATHSGNGAGVACAVLMPPAPILVPGVGNERGETAVASCRGARAATELGPPRFGVILSAGDKRSGVLLLAVEGILTVEQQLQLARVKGRIDPAETGRLQRFGMDHFAESA